MASRSFFIQSPEDARRHLDTLAQGLKKVALGGWVSGAACTALALMVTRYFGIPVAHAGATPGAHEMSGISLVTWFLAIAMLLFSTLYFVSGWALERQKSWARYVTAGTFLFKILVCVLIGRASVASMAVFLLIASADIYGLWVLLSKETGQLLNPTPPAKTVPYSPATQVRQP